MPSAVAATDRASLRAAKNQRSPLEKDRDQARIAEMHLKGYSTSEISEVLGLSKRQIMYDLSDIARQYQREAQTDYRAELNRQLRKIDVLEKEAWRQYEASKQQREVVTRRQKRSDAGGDSTEVGRRTDQRDGDVRFLSVIQWCIDKRNELLGLYPDESSRLTSALPQGVREVVYELPAAEHVPVLREDARALRAPEPKTRPVLVEMSPDEIWGAPEQRVIDIGPNPE